jgi:hypothetical protein
MTDKKKLFIALGAAAIAVIQILLDTEDKEEPK